MLKMANTREDPTLRTLRSRSNALALPWTDAALMLEHCTACGACVEACPQNILQLAGGTHPELSFSNECTFCTACAEACPEDVFVLERDPPWQAVARIGSGCLEPQGINCRVCEDACEARALRARPQVGGTAVMTVDEDFCTGCGACVSICPTDAITVERPRAAKQANAA